MLENIRVVLVGSQEPMNVGSVARAMQNFGLSDLRLVAPEPRVERDLGLGPNSWAYRLAVHAEEILERALVVRTPLEALGGVQFVVGTTVRKREIYTGPVVTAREMAPLALHQAQKGKVAILFGRETAGLTTDELDLSQLIVRIPTAPKQPSLNLAQAVMVLCYELFVAAQEPALPPQGGHSLASREALEALFADLGDWVLETGFSDLNRQPYAVRRFRRLLHKANLTPGEVQFLRGFLHQSRWYARQGRREEG
jgi:tRNA/rRNA methyltransferase